MTCALPLLTLTSCIRFILSCSCTVHAGDAKPQESMYDLSYASTPFSFEVARTGSPRNASCVFNSTGQRLVFKVHMLAVYTDATLSEESLLSGNNHVDHPTTMHQYLIRYSDTPTDVNTST